MMHLFDVGDKVFISKNPPTNIYINTNNVFSGYMTVAEMIGLTMTEKTQIQANIPNLTTTYASLFDLSETEEYLIIAIVDISKNNINTEYYQLYDAKADKHFLYSSDYDMYIRKVPQVNNSAQQYIDSIMEEFYKVINKNKTPYPLGAFVYDKDSNEGTILKVYEHTVDIIYEVYFDSLKLQKTVSHNDVEYRGETNWRWEVANNN